MQAIAFIAFMIWIMGSVLRGAAQADSARIAVEERRLDRYPRLGELAGDAVFWWLWIVFDFSRWIGCKVYGNGRER